MQALNSFSVGNARRALLMAGVGMLLAFLLLAPLAAHAASSTITVSTDKSYYYGPNGAATVSISGTVTPAPGVTGTNVAYTVVSPGGAQVIVGQTGVDATSGSYSATFVTGGTSSWVNGTYTVNVQYNGATASANFQYGNVSSSQGGTGTTTTVMVTTTIVEQTTTTVNAQTTVTVNAQTTTTVNAQTTTTVVQQTTVTAANSDTGLYVGIVGVVIAIIAGALSVMALRRH